MRISLYRAIALSVLGMLLLGPMMTARAAEASSGGGDGQVLSQFNRFEVQEGEAVKISDRQKHRVLFFMGASLLILVLTTAALGVAMGVYGKPVFLAHMVMAGLTVSLTIAHAIAAMVWFYPF